MEVMQPVMAAVHLLMVTLWPLTGSRSPTQSRSSAQCDRRTQHCSQGNRTALSAELRERWDTALSHRV